MKTVLIPTKLDTVASDLLTQHGDYKVVQDEGTALPELAAAHPDTHALIVRSEKVTAEVMDALPSLKVVVRAGAGFNTIDTRYARSKGIDVMNTPGANSNAVAEEVVAMMLADARNIVAADISTREGRWEKKSFMGSEISGKTVGIVGLGNIGQLVSKRLSGFDVRMIGYDPMISSERAEEVGVELITELADLFAQSDYISLHIPETDETRGIVGAKLLGCVKDGTTIINCARAGIIDEAALRAEKAKRSIRFLNDVYAKDAAGDKSVSDIADLMLPHLGASTNEANYNAARRAAEELIDLDDKGITSFIVNRDIPEGLDEAYCELANSLARVCRAIVGTGATPKVIQTSIYGTLEPYADWLLTPAVAGICPEMDRSSDHGSVCDYLAEMGIEYENRTTDPKKHFASSITVDLEAEIDAETTKEVSVRGTIAEGVQMVARINEFDRLYFEPVGCAAFFLYQDRPGVIGQIGAELASAGINIEDIRNPHHIKTGRSLAIMKTNQPVPEDTVKHIGATIGAVTAFSISF
jgi:D-3-phosphoglycerate dehydrogenase